MCLYKVILGYERNYFETNVKGNVWSGSQTSLLNLLKIGMIENFVKKQ